MSIQEQYDKIYRFCYFKLQNAARAEDVTQETFLKFFSQSSYINRGKPLAYLYTIARNLCADSFRRPERHVPLKDDIQADDGAIERLEVSVAIKQALKQLDTDKQEVLLLRYANELSMAEIARITGLSRFAARRRIAAALSELKQSLGEDIL